MLPALFYELGTTNVSKSEEGLQEAYRTGSQRHPQSSSTFLNSRKMGSIRVIVSGVYGRPLKVQTARGKLYTS
ncbi:hypothetical protein M0802_001607 [Mischocyttarus mexicanus]|nr:hypothetical protein M0802_001607 [Mischocyttarus mexicanus]